LRGRFSGKQSGNAEVEIPGGSSAPGSAFVFASVSRQGDCGKDEGFFFAPGIGEWQSF